MQPITDKIIDKVKAWQARPLETIYPFVWLDAIHYKIKDGGKYVSKAVYTVLGMGIDGKKDILGLYLSQTEVQLCVVHQIRNSLKYVASKDQKEFMRDLKLVYQATTKELAEDEL